SPAGATINGNTITAPQGNYTVTATLGNCTSAASNQANVNQQPATPAKPTLSAVTQPTCTNPNGSFTITNYNSSYTYTVSPSNTGATINGNTITAPQGTYTVTATLGNCSSVASNTATVNQPTGAPAQPTLSAVTQPTCTNPNGSFTITNYNSSYTYTVNPSNTGATISGNTVTAPQGTYTVTATLNGCSSVASNLATVNAQPATPAKPTLSAVTQPACPNLNGSFTITNYNSSYTYTVSPSNTGATISGNTVTAPAGTYTVTATLGNCSSVASNTATVNQPTGAPAQPTLSTVTQPTCTTATGSFTITNYNSSYTYTVSPSNTGATISGNTVTAPAGTYTVTATLGNCSSVASSPVTVNAQPATPAAPTVTLSQPSCTAATGSITVTAPLGSNLLYSINSIDYQPGTTFSNVAPGTYRVTVKNSTSGCISNYTQVIIDKQPTGCNVAGIYHTSVTCSNYNSNPGNQLIGQLCYSTRSNKVANVTPGQFFYFTTITAPSASFCIDIIETKSCSNFAYFNIQQNNQVTLYNASCGNVASGVQVTPGIGQICINNAVPNTRYILSVKYDSKSVVGSPYTGAPPTCVYSFESRINGTTVANSATSINLVPNCSASIADTGDTVAKQLKVTIAPNPAVSDFGLSIESPSDENVLIRISDVNGRFIKEIKADIKETIYFGEDLARGMYFIEVTQGVERKTVRALKL
ncbi:T9SS type A sorting domain-containing protein, partial [Flavobacterium pedocola]